MPDAHRLNTPATDVITSDATAAEGVAQAEERTHRSLFGEILDWMLVPLLLLWPLSIAITYMVAKSIANEPFDRALEDKVTVVAQQVKEVNGRVITRLTGPATDILHADDVDNIYYQILDSRGIMVEGDPEMPLPTEADPPQPWATKFRYDFVHNTEVRIAYIYVDLHKTQVEPQLSIEPRLALVQVGETLEKRSQLVNQIIKGVIVPEFIILPVALILVWFALTRGLRPLAELQQRIRARRPDDLSPIDSGYVPEEILPLVGSLNDMLERLSQSIKIQKRFIADAAHQMKTPLAGMRMQSELALRQTDQSEIHKSLEQLAKSSSSATRMVNQLLALARAENQTPATKPMQLLELSELARDSLQNWVQTSFNKKIDLGFEQADYSVLVKGDATMLQELLNNLIDNALNYTPAGGYATVRVLADEGRQLAFLEIEDNGPGIAIHEREHIFERFYRILGSNVEGSGLGLAIVREIAQQHNAEIEILNNPHCKEKKSPGCLVRITLHLEPNTVPLDYIN
ncbi:sensor histidine kinase [Herminiimonas fonticola]|uniref:histidine kinase n=1 Tax=Herminiimonas fonticola TaxID=303380 RepID=A0A4R6GHE8_9BURK|nr:sensor histidine kinase [Herminiimonas fonticola]RBA25284.1 Two-component sensor kinase N-terminal [Herminiimonas fonticola]TDN94399.1 two-component system sensor histidine kinase TctE [Herminiimonas fonticola]